MICAHEIEYMYIYIIDWSIAKFILKYPLTAVQQGDCGHVLHTNISDYTTHPTVSCVPGNTMATVIVGDYECWDGVTAREYTAHTSPIATIWVVLAL